MAPRSRTFVYRPHAPTPEAPMSPRDIGKLTRALARGMQQGDEYDPKKYPPAILAAARAMIGGHK